jgi:hypothetical protein
MISIKRAAIDKIEKIKEDSIEKLFFIIYI